MNLLHPGSNSWQVRWAVNATASFRPGDTHRRCPCRQVSAATSSPTTWPYFAPSTHTPKKRTRQHTRWDVRELLQKLTSAIESCARSSSYARILTLERTASAPDLRQRASDEQRSLKFTASEPPAQAISTGFPWPYDPGIWGVPLLPWQAPSHSWHLATSPVATGQVIRAKNSARPWIQDTGRRLPAPAGT